MTDMTKPPVRPICKDADGTPCKYAGSCAASRQVIQAGYAKSLGQWVRNREPLRGKACWAYIGLEDRAAQQALAAARVPQETPAP